MSRHPRLIGLIPFSHGVVAEGQKRSPRARLALLSRTAERGGEVGLAQRHELANVLGGAPQQLLRGGAFDPI